MEDQVVYLTPRPSTMAYKVQERNQALGRISEICSEVSQNLIINENRDGICLNKCNLDCLKKAVENINHITNLFLL